MSKTKLSVINNFLYGERGKICVFAAVVPHPNRIIKNVSDVFEREDNLLQKDTFKLYI